MRRRKTLHKHDPSPVAECVSERHAIVATSERGVDHDERCVVEGERSAAAQIAVRPTAGFGAVQLRRSPFLGPQACEVLADDVGVDHERVGASSHSPGSRIALRTDRDAGRIVAELAESLEHCLAGGGETGTDLR